MQFTMRHNNFNVLDLTKSLAFYQTALGLTEVGRKDTPDFTLVFLGDGVTAHQIELTWLKDRTEPYDLGDNEIHLCFAADDFNAAYALHRDMGVICYENTGMGLYFIEDPDGYWLEITPGRR